MLDFFTFRFQQHCCTIQNALWPTTNTATTTKKKKVGTGTQRTAQLQTCSYNATPPRFREKKKKAESIGWIRSRSADVEAQSRTCISVGTASAWLMNGCCLLSLMDFHDEVILNASRSSRQIIAFVLPVWFDILAEAKWIQRLDNKQLTSASSCRPPNLPSKFPLPFKNRKAVDYQKAVLGSHGTFPPLVWLSLLFHTHTYTQTQARGEICMRGLARQDELTGCPNTRAAS